MAERLASALAGHGEHLHAKGSVVSDDDLRLARVVIPLKRDRVTSIVACVEFYKHAASVRLQPTSSHPCQTLGCPRDRPACTRAASSDAAVPPGTPPGPGATAPSSSAPRSTGGRRSRT